MNSTDVLTADRILVEDRIYRLLPIRDSLKSTEYDKPRGSSHRVEDDDDDDYDPNLPIIHRGDEFIATIYVPGPVFGYIVGPKFKMITALQQQYGVKITTPEKKNLEAGITIQDPWKKNVSIVYSSIQNRINMKRFKTEFTHFVSIPVNSSNIKESFLKFKDEVLTKYGTVRGIVDSIFQNPAKLHITVTTLVLFDIRDKENSSAILNKCTDSFLNELGEKEIVIHVQGLEIMNDDESEVDVLYAKLREIDDDNRLQILADKIMKEFVDANLSRKDYNEDHVKLHITLMNKRFGKKDSFDARKILKDFGDYDFGQIAVSEIHISTRYTGGLDEFYNCIFKMKLKS